MTKLEFVQIVTSSILAVIAFTVTPFLVFTVGRTLNPNFVHYIILTINTIIILSVSYIKTPKSEAMWVTTAYLTLMYVFVSILPTESEPFAHAFALWFISVLAYICLLLGMLAFCMGIVFLIWIIECTRKRRLISYSELQTLGTQNER